MELIQEQKLKGFITNTAVLMSNRELKGFIYSEEQKENNCIDFNTKIQIPINPFYRFIEMLNKLKVVSVLFKIDDKRHLNLSAVYDVGTFNLNLDSAFFEGENVKVRISIEYLIKVLKNYDSKEMKEKEFINLSLSNDYPLLLEFKQHWILIAPRVDED